MLWLIAINHSDLFVCLLSVKDGAYSLASIGPRQAWDIQDPDSFLTAADLSLSQAGQQFSLPPDQEPEQVAFVLPPFWTGPDNEILPDKIKLIKKLCQKLDLTPVGFVNNDEAILEQQQKIDAFPASFILLHLTKTSLTLSIVYLGKIKSRLKRDFEIFDPAILKQSLLDLNIDSALPPQIIIFGDFTADSIDQIKNYPWTSHQDVELFLHLPEVKTYSDQDLASFYTQMISSQLKGVSGPEPEPEPEPEPVISEPDKKPPLLDTVTEIDPDQLGFGQGQPDQDYLAQTPDSIIPPPVKSKLKLKLPQIKLKLPKLKLHPPKNFAYILAACPLLILIPFLFSSAQLTLFLTPINFNQSYPVILSTQPATDTSQVTITSKNLTVSSSSSIATTGQKTTGEKATGPITIYNRLEQSIDLTAGTVLQDSSGKKYEIVNPVTVPQSSANLEEGIITLGQAKAVISASDFGPEYNIDSDQQLTFTKADLSGLIVKTSQALSGGNRRLVNVVSSDDKKAVKDKVEDQLSLAVAQKVDQDFKDLTGLIDQSVQIQTSRIEYSREIGEETDELTASITAQVIAFFLPTDQKQQVINQFLSTSPDFNQAQIEPDAFNLSFVIDQKSPTQANAVMTIAGSALPKIDQTGLKKQISGRFQNQLLTIIKQFNPRIYDYQLNTNFTLISFINPLPFNQKNIDIILKSANNL